MNSKLSIGRACPLFLLRLLANLDRLVARRLFTLDALLELALFARRDRLVDRLIELR